MLYKQGLAKAIELVNGKEQQKSFSEEDVQQRYGEMLEAQPARDRRTFLQRRHQPVERSAHAIATVFASG